MRNIVLIGFMGSGKSSVARSLAKKLGLEYIDTDTVIEKEEGKSVSEIFRIEGEERFRALEKKVVETVSKYENKVISCGGGVVLDSQNVSNLKENGILIYLSVDPSIIIERVKNSKGRPLLEVADKEKEVIRLFEQREKKYHEAADIIVDAGNMSINKTTERILVEVKGTFNYGG